jgi:hypothetical protein
MASETLRCAAALASWWRPITLENADGVFAMEIGAFKQYFAGFGVAV